MEGPRERQGRRSPSSSDSAASAGSVDSAMKEGMRQSQIVEDLLQAFLRVLKGGHRPKLQVETKSSPNSARTVSTRSDIGAPIPKSNPITGSLDELGRSKAPSEASYHENRSEDCDRASCDTPLTSPETFYSPVSPSTFPSEPDERSSRSNPKQAESISRENEFSIVVDRAQSPTLPSVVRSVGLPLDDPRFATIYSLLQSSLLENTKLSLELEKTTAMTNGFRRSSATNPQSTSTSPNLLLTEALRAIVYLEDDLTICLEEIVALQTRLEDAHSLITAQQEQTGEIHSLQQQNRVLRRSLDESERYNELSQKQLGEVFASSQRQSERFRRMGRKLVELQEEVFKVNTWAERGDETI